MKDQYFGDVNDFRKYGLLRLLTISDALRLGVCWMLTRPDGRGDGKLLKYLSQPEGFFRSDPELFAWLRQVVCVENDRRVSRVESSGLLGRAVFQSRMMTDSFSDRRVFFSECATLFAGCDLVFFDPDNGLEVRSKPRGGGGSHKYLYWDEAVSLFSAGHSVLIYQHFPREKRLVFVERISAQLAERTCAAAVFSFRTPNVVFLLAAQARHAGVFRNRLPKIRELWAEQEITAAENPTH
jgi:hypothetical protein